MSKRCDHCTHSMETEPENVGQLYCIESPATPLLVNDRINSYFPMMQKFGKCDKFEPGETQPLSKPDEA